MVLPPPKDPGKALIGQDWVVAREYSDLIGQALGMYTLLEPEGGFERGGLPEWGRGPIFPEEGGKR